MREEIGDLTVIRAMEQTPRELFVPEASVHLAYEDMPLPIGEGQTISQPYIVALMVSALELRPSDTVLEIGTGSGYQAAILSRLANRVVSVERIEGLATAAKMRLEYLGCSKVEVYLSGPDLGWPAEAPYDAIVVAAAARRLPRRLMDQLATDGRLVVPVGSRQGQELTKVTKIKDGFSFRTLGACRFVPLIGEDGWPEEGFEEGP